MDTFILMIIAIGMLGIPVTCFFTLLTLLFKKWKYLLKYSLISLGSALLCTTMGLISYSILNTETSSSNVTTSAVPISDNSNEESLEQQRITENVLPEKINEVNENDEQAEKSNEVSIEDMIAMIESNLTQHFGEDNYTISCDYDYNIITLDVWKEGVATELAVIKLSGGNAANEDWMYVKNSFVKLAESICNLMQACGHEDFTLVLNIRNDINHENGLLSIFNTTIIYDALEEE